jgi:hypothetical protein
MYIIAGMPCQRQYLRGQGFRGVSMPLMKQGCHADLFALSNRITDVSSRLRNRVSEEHLHVMKGLPGQ